MDGQLDGYCLLGPDTHAHRDTCIDICLLKRCNTMCLHTEYAHTCAIWHKHGHLCRLVRAQRNMHAQAHTYIYAGVKHPHMNTEIYLYRDT